ncbi:MAG: hypothetical protein IVW53_15705 [Chloroflexi bacterium]|nr:hypothetical protein [Chloroflexota bacterium]
MEASFAKSVSDDVNHYDCYLDRGFGTEIFTLGAVSGQSTYTLPWQMYGNRAYSLYVRAVDGDGNVSQATSTLTGTSSDASPAMGVYNGGFETPEAFTPNMPDGFTVTSGSGAVVGLDGSDRNSGAYAMLMDTTASATPITVTSRLLRAIAGVMYHAEIAAKTGASAAIMSAQVQYYSSAIVSGRVVYTAQGSPVTLLGSQATTSAWTIYTMPVFIPPSASPKIVAMRLIVSVPASASTPLRIDDLACAPQIGRTQLLGGNVVGTPTGTVTTAILAGGGLDVVLAGGGVTSLPVSSYPLECKPGDVLIAQVEADLVTAGVTFSQVAQYYLAGVAVGSAVTTLTSQAPDGVVHEATITAPSGVDSVVVTATMVHGLGGTQHVTLVRNNIRRAVGNKDLDVITDPTRLAPVTSSTTPIVIYDNAGVARAQLYWSGGGTLSIVALSTTGAHGVEIRDAAGGILDVTDGYVNSAGSLGFKIGGGAAITQHLSATGSNTALVVAANSQSTFTVTVTGAAVGDSVVATPDGDPSTGVQWSAYVSAANTVTIKVGNITTASKTLTLRSWRCDVWKH